MPLSPTPKKILIYRLGSLGDTTVALPCFHLVERTFPDAERVLLTNFPIHAKAPASAAVLGDSGLVHNYMRYSVGTRSLGELWRLAREIRAYKPDALIYLMPARPTKAVQRDKWFFKLACGISRIIGLPESDQTIRQQDPITGLYQPEAQRLANTISTLGDANINNLANWDLRLTEAEKAKAKTSLGELASTPLIVCGPGTKMQAKDWGQDNWRALLGRLSQRYKNHALALIGAPEDSEVANYAARGWTGPSINLCGQLTPRETAAVLSRASIFLGPDSGPMHLAACFGVPCVIAFSARGLPGVWYPNGLEHKVVYHQVNCYGCNLETCIIEQRKCLSSISIDEMAAAVESILH